MSGSRDIESDGVMMCGRVAIGNERPGILGDTMSCGGE